MSKSAAQAVKQKRKRSGTTWKHDIRLNWSIYLIYLPIFVYVIIFNYLPMFGIVMAFQEFKPTRGFLGSKWVGFENFIKFFSASEFPLIMRNTLVISILGLSVGMIAAILFTLLLNEIKFSWFKKPVQTITYMPNFISAVVIAGMVIDFTSSNGIVTNFLVKVFGIPRENLLMNASYFWAINLLSGLWQGLGASSIVYVSALGNISQELVEAAALDGANRLQRAWHITLTAIRPTIATMLIMNIGSLLYVGSEKILLLYNPTIYSTADVISTHVVRMGLEKMQYGYSAAVGLFNSVVGTILLVGSNYLSRKLTETSIF